MQTGDGGYLIWGASYGVDKDVRKNYILKIDQNGNVHWGKTLESGISKVIETSDGEYVAWRNGGGLVVRLDWQGNLRWRKTLCLEGMYVKNPEVYNVIPARDMGCFVNGDGFILKLNAAGAIVWQKEIIVGERYSLQQTPYGGCVMAGASSSQEKYIVFVKLDASGAVVFETVFRTTASTLRVGSVEPTADGGYLISGSFRDQVDDVWGSFFIKTKQNGLLLWQKRYRDLEGGGIVAETGDGGYLVMLRPWLNTSAGLFVKLDDQGTSVWQKTIGGSRTNFFVGSLLPQIGTENYYAFGGAKVVKFNADLTTPGCDVITIIEHSEVGFDEPYVPIQHLSVIAATSGYYMEESAIEIKEAICIVEDYESSVLNMCAAGYYEPQLESIAVYSCGFCLMIQNRDEDRYGPATQLKNSLGEEIYSFGRLAGDICFGKLDSDTYTVAISTVYSNGSYGNPVFDGAPAYDVTVECSEQVLPDAPNKAPATLEVPEKVLVQPQFSQLSFPVRNAGEGMLIWEIISVEYLDEQKDWIVDLDPASGESNWASWVTGTIDDDGLPTGTYTARLGVASNGGYGETLLIITAQGEGVTPTLDAQFSGCNARDEIPWGVQFFDESEGNVVAWEWTFGDGGFSYEKNPYYTFYEPGSHTVGLTVTDVNGATDTLEMDGCIRVGACPVDAEFSAQQQMGTVPLTVQFSDQSEGPVSLYTWDFGDGGTSVQQHPEHVYRRSGVYTVTLTVKGAGCTSTEIKTNLIKVERGYVPPMPICPLTESLAGMSCSGEHEQTLRDFRDVMLSTSLTGKLLAGLYYASAEDVNAVIDQDDELQIEIGDLVTELSPRIKAVVDGRRTVITQAELQLIKDVLNRLADNGGAVMRMTVNFVMDKIENEAFLQQYGIFFISEENN
ncbi:MAG: PKD domain-containing protein [Deltaproteobacteria bacterium]|nr:PKD domain-containing protein [Deltaproteobacteria bacterium]